MRAQEQRGRERELRILVRDLQSGSRYSHYCGFRNCPRGQALRCEILEELGPMIQTNGAIQNIARAGDYHVTYTTLFETRGIAEMNVVAQYSGIVRLVCDWPRAITFGALD